MHQTIQVHQLENAKNYTKWLKQIKHLLTTVGNKKTKIINGREKIIWLENSPWIRHAISVSWHILMLERQQLPSVFFSIRDAFIKLVKHMKVLHRWTGWSRSKSVELRLLP